MHTVNCQAKHDLSSKEGRAAYARDWRRRRLLDPEFRENERRKARDRYRNNPEVRARQRLWEKANRTGKPRKNPRAALLSGAKHRATKFGLTCTITVDDIVIAKRCPVLGIDWEVGRGKNGSRTLDRVDSSLGYIPGNVMVVSRRANSLKSNATIEELESIVVYMRRAYS